MKHWSKFDFNFRDKASSIRFKIRGAKARATGGNIIQIEIENEDFDLVATGFDIHRDLIVRVDEVQEELGRAEQAQEVAS